MLALAVPDAWAADEVQTIRPGVALPPAAAAAAAVPAIPAGEGEGAADEEAPPEKPDKSIAAKAKQAADESDKPKTFNAVRLQGLNKVTARISTVDAPLGVVTRFENLEIIPLRCWQAPPEEQPENAALLEIRELKPGEGPQAIFKGWMFASSPGLSSLEHAVYDITVLECENVDNTK